LSRGSLIYLILHTLREGEEREGEERGGEEREGGERGGGAELLAGILQSSQLFPKPFSVILL
jgi:hypothetical protein